MARPTFRAIALTCCLVLVALTVAGCAAMPAPTGPTITYRIRVSSNPSVPIAVECHIEHYEPGSLDLTMLQPPRETHRTAAHSIAVQTLDTRSKAGPSSLVAQSSDDGHMHWIVDIPTSGDLTFTYSLPPALYPETISTRVAHDHAYLEARSLIIYPAEWENAPIMPLSATVQVQIEGPPGWNIRSRWPVSAAGPIYLPGTWQDLIHSVVAVGPYELYDHAIAGFRARFYVSPTISPFTAEKKIAAWARQAAAIYRFFGSDPTGNTDSGMELFVVILSDRAQQEPSALTLPGNTLVIQGNHDLSGTIDEVFGRHVVNLWIGEAVRFASERRVVADTWWITEGWAEYLRCAIRLSHGTYSPLQFWTHYREIEADAETHPLAGLSLQDAAVQRAGDPALQTYMRQRGALGALLLNERLHHSTENAVDLATACVGLAQEHNSYQGNGALTASQTMATLTSMSGEDYQSLYESIFVSQSSLDLSSIHELSGPPVGVARSVVAPDGVRVYYQWFDGPTERPAIYIPGGPGLAPYDAMYLASDPLQGVLDVAYMEPRGSGRSDRPGSAAYSLDNMVNDIDVVREDLGSRRITLIGHGWGGYYCLTYASRYPERIDTLVLLAPIPSLPHIVLAEMDDLEGLIEEKDADLAYRLFRLRERGVLTVHDLTQLDRLLIESGGYGSDLEMVQDSMRAAYHHYVDKSALPPDLSLNNGDILPALVGRDALLDKDLLAEMPAEGFSALVLHGTRDHVVPTKVLAELSEIIGAKLSTIPDSGHYFYLENPGYTTAAIADYIRQVPY